MAGARLKRFDVTLWRDSDNGDDRQVPAAGATIDFYRQGATVNDTDLFGAGIAPGATAEVDVYDVGALKPSDAVLVGPGGPTLVVEPNGIVSPTRVILRNNGAVPVRIENGSRLILTASRPTLYKDPYGTSALGTSVTADVNGRIAGYLREDRYDYVRSPARASRLDATSWTSKTWSGSNTMSWNHSASGESVVVFVAISWQSLTGTETLAQVTYDGVAMAPFATLPNLAVFILKRPPLGQKQIVATWSGNGHKGAVGGAVSGRGVSQGSLPLVSGQGNSINPSVDVANLDAFSFLFDAVAVKAVSTPAPTLTATAPQVEKWNTIAGDASQSDLTMGAGSTRPNLSGPAATLSMSWALSAARAWSQVAVEMKAAPVLVIDAGVSVLVEAPPWINVRDFQSLEAAIATIPEGRELFLPEGEYVVPALVITKPNIVLRGVGEKTVIRARDANPNYDLLTVQRDHVQIRDLVLDGNATAAGVGACLYVEWPNNENRVGKHYILDNVLMRKGGAAGMRVRDALLVLATNCRFNGNRGPGVLLERASVNHPGLTNIRFLGCEFVGNGGRGMQNGGIDPKTPFVASLSLLGCRFKNNTDSQVGGEYKARDLWLTGTKGLFVNGCQFEVTQSFLPGDQFVRLDQSDSAVIEGCLFRAVTGVSVVRCVYYVDSSNGRCTDNVVFGTYSRPEPIEFHDEAAPTFGNHRDGATAIVLAQKPTMELDAGALCLPRYATSPAAGSFPVGTMIWVDAGGGRVQVVDLNGSTKIWRLLEFV